jgi:hypothetical protein
MRREGRIKEFFDTVKFCSQFLSSLAFSSILIVSNFLIENYTAPIVRISFYTGFGLWTVVIALIRAVSFLNNS